MTSAVESAISELITKLNVANPPQSMRTKIVAIDGFGGAGKSTFAKLLAEQLAVRGDVTQVVCADDFASHKDPNNWSESCIKKVLIPLSEERDATYQPYDWELGRSNGWRYVSPAKYVILEGVSTSRREIRPFLTMRVWIDTPENERRRRILERDGAKLNQLWDQWFASESKYAAEENPQAHAEFVVDGMSF